MLKTYLKKSDVFLGPILVPVALVVFLIRWVFAPRTKKNLIIRPGGLGDLVLLTLSLELFDSQYKKHYVFLIEQRSKAWADYLELDYYLYDDPSTIWRMPRFNRIFNSEQLFGLSQVYAIALCSSLNLRKHLRSFSSNRLSFFSKSVPYDPYDAQEVMSFAKLIFDQRVEVFSPLRVRPPQEHQMLYFGGSTSMGRRLEKSSWQNILKAWSQSHTLAVASPSEEQELKTIISAFSNYEHFKTKDFSSLMELVSRSKRILTIDSGALHICSYFGVPSDAVFTNGRFNKWKPLSAHSRRLMHQVPCQPCVLFGQEPPCPFSYQCKILDGQSWQPV